MYTARGTPEGLCAHLAARLFIGAQSTNTADSIVKDYRVDNEVHCAVSLGSIVPQTVCTYTLAACKMDTANSAHHTIMHISCLLVCSGISVYIHTLYTTCVVCKML